MARRLLGGSSNRFLINPFPIERFLISVQQRDWRDSISGNKWKNKVKKYQLNKHLLKILDGNINGKQNY